MSWDTPNKLASALLGAPLLNYETFQVAVGDTPTLIVPASNDTVVAIVKIIAGDPVDLGKVAVTFGTGFRLLTAGDLVDAATVHEIYGICASSKSCTVCVFRTHT